MESQAQLRRDVTDALVAGAIAVRRADEFTGLAAEAVAADPLREPAVLLLIRALAASGQAPEALRVGRRYRDRLADETGLDPSPALDELVRKVAANRSMPLAIELAAGRLSTFALADLHRRLDRSLDLLGGRPSGEARHRTLRETVEWSYRLLSDDERRLFRFLSVFVDGADLATAERLNSGPLPRGNVATRDLGETGHRCRSRRAPRLTAPSEAAPPRRRRGWNNRRTKHKIESSSTRSYL